MSDKTESITVTSDGMTLSLLIWNRFKRPMPGTLEAAIELNPGIALLGPHLPLGTVVVMPIPTPRPVNEINAVRLWG